MIGNNVRLLLTGEPNYSVRGELRKLDETGVMVYIHGTFGETSKEYGLKFYPMHRVLEMTDHGPVHR